MMFGMKEGRGRLGFDIVEPANKADATPRQYDNRVVV